MTPTQDLILGVLAARTRMGDHLWTFDSRHKKALSELAEMGLVTTASGVIEKTVRASLTAKGEIEVLSSTYKIPSDPYRTLERVRDVVRTYEDWFEYQPEDGWRLQRDLMAALGMERLKNE